MQQVDVIVLYRSCGHDKPFLDSSGHFWNVEWCNFQYRTFITHFDNFGNKQADLKQLKWHPMCGGEDTFFQCNTIGHARAGFSYNEYEPPSILYGVFHVTSQNNQSKDQFAEDSSSSPLPWPPVVIPSNPLRVGLVRHLVCEKYFGPEQPDNRIVCELLMFTEQEIDKIFERFKDKYNRTCLRIKCSVIAKHTFSSERKKSIYEGHIVSPDTPEKLLKGTLNDGIVVVGYYLLSGWNNCD